MCDAFPDGVIAWWRWPVGARLFCNAAARRSTLLIAAASWALRMALAIPRPYPPSGRPSARQVAGPRTLPRPSPAAPATAAPATCAGDPHCAKVATFARPARSGRPELSLAGCCSLGLRLSPLGFCPLRGSKSVPGCGPPRGCTTSGRAEPWQTELDRCQQQQPEQQQEQQGHAGRRSAPAAAFSAAGRTRTLQALRGARAAKESYRLSRPRLRSRCDSLALHPAAPRPSPSVRLRL
jgi:hypothetical protein